MSFSNRITVHVYKVCRRGSGAMNSLLVAPSRKHNSFVNEPCGLLSPCTPQAGAGAALVPVGWHANMVNANCCQSDSRRSAMRGKVAVAGASIQLQDTGCMTL